MAIEIVDLPIIPLNMVMFHSFLYVYQRVYVGIYPMNGMKHKKHHRNLLGYKTARWCTHGDLTTMVLLGTVF
jgi:hypothetical protein